MLTELRDVDNKLAELTEQQVAAKDQLKRVDQRGGGAVAAYSLLFPKGNNEK